jgi:hypothetical protein
MSIARGQQNGPASEVARVADQKLYQGDRVVLQVVTGDLDPVAGVLKRILLAKHAGVDFYAAFRERSDRGDPGNRVTEHNRWDRRLECAGGSKRY